MLRKVNPRPPTPRPKREPKPVVEPDVPDMTGFTPEKIAELQARVAARAEELKDGTAPAAMPEVAAGGLAFKVKFRKPWQHPGQLLLWNSQKKRIIIRAGRRGGKTTGAAMVAVRGLTDGKRVLYACPTIDQVQKFWKECKRALDEPIRYGYYKKNETDHTIEPRSANPNSTDEPRIRAKTAWNAETLRGDYADLLILDEWQSMDETAWTEVGAPMLIDRNGNVVFIYTPPSLETRSASKARDPQHAAKMYKRVKEDPAWECIHFASAANPFVSRSGLEEVSRNMSALAYRQEILAEDTEEIPGALWTRAIIEQSRYRGALPEMRRIVVAIDPSGGNTTEVGIVAAGEAENGHIYVLRDSSMRAPKPHDWAQRGIQLYYELSADRLIAERNYGGDMVEETIRNVDENVSYKDVNASRGKLVRAEPVLALFQQERMHLVCRCGRNPCLEFADLEEELVTYTAAPGQKSPNRLDAMVWCGIELSGSGSLGLLDYFKSGKAEEQMARTPYGSIQKLAKPTDVAEVAVADQTPRCPKCSSVTVQQLPMTEMRCQACAHQWFPKGNPTFQRPLGGRRITLDKTA